MSFEVSWPKIRLLCSLTEGRLLADSACLGVVIRQGRFGTDALHSGANFCCVKQLR